VKICFIVGAFPNMKCGVGDYTHRLAEELAKRQNEVHIITSKKAHCKSENLNIHNIMEKWDFSEAKNIIELLKKIKPDVVNIEYPSNEYRNNYMIGTLPLRIKRKIKCIVTETIHEFECNSLKSRIRVYLNFVKLDKIIVVENEFIDEIKKNYKKAKIQYIPISSNIPRSEMTDEKKKNLIEKYKLDGKKVVSYFGFASPKKGIEYLLNSISKLDENTRLLFIGNLNKDNEYEQSLLQLIEELGIQDRVIITGFFDSEKDVADLLQISDVCVLPFIDGVKKRNGSFLAAYNQKISVITTSDNEKDKNGIYYVRPKNKEELLEKIKFVLEQNEAFEREELTWENVAKEYIKEYLI